MGAELVILAAGLGRRFGGLKQLAPVGPGDEAIMDYTVYDALRSGFDRVVLVIRPEIEEAIRAHVERGFGRRVEVELACQRLDHHADGLPAPAGRSRPWGTGHAVLTAAPCLHGPFAVANADDLYGAAAIAVLGAFLNDPSRKSSTWAMVGFPIAATLPDGGGVTRALVRVEDGWMRAIDEVSGLRRHPDGACWDAEDGLRIVSGDVPVSMNLWGFGPEVLSDLKQRFRQFLDDDPGVDREFLLPVILGQAVGQGVARVRVLPATSRWCGMTSAEDQRAVRAELAGLVMDEVYPERLWG